MWHTKNTIFREMQFWSHCYTVVSYQALFRLSVYKIPAVYLSGAKNVCFCTIRDFGSPDYFLAQNFNFLAGLCSGAGCFESHFVGNPKDRFSHDEAHIPTCHPDREK